MKNHVLHALAAIIFIGSLTGTSYAQTAGDVAPSTAAACIDLTVDLTYGQTSSNVTTLQQFLVEEGFLTVAPSGYFGNATLNAVKAFQTQKGILSSGYVGPITRAAIKTASGCTGSAGSTTGSSAGSTSGSVTPTITLKVNGSEGPLTIAYDSNLTFTWTATASVTNCRMGAPFNTGAAATIATFVPNSGTAGSLISSTNNMKSLTPATYQTLYGSAPSTANLQVDYSMSCSHSDPSIGLLTDTVRVISTTAANAPTTNTNSAVTYTSSASTSAQITSFTVTPTTFTAGQMVTASWTSTQTDSCFVESTENGSFTRRSGGSSSSKNYYPTAMTTFKLVCTDSNDVEITSSQIVASPATTGGGGGTGNTSAEIIRYFSKSISTNPVQYPRTLQLMWDTNGAYSCRLDTTITPSNGGNQIVNTINNLDRTEGILNVTPLAGTTVYKLTCYTGAANTGGTDSREVSITAFRTTDATITGATTSISAVPAMPNFVARCTLVNAETSSYKIWLTWNAVPGATSYPVRLLKPSGVTDIMGVPPSNTWLGQYVFPAPTGTSWHWNVGPGTYTYWGHAWNEFGWSGYQQKTVICSPSASAEEGPTLANAIAPTVLGASTQCIDLPINLHRGIEGSSVTTLQNFLMSLGLLDEVTGFYGDKTVTAVKEYQGSRGLAITGMVYDLTRDIIKTQTCK